MKVKLEESFLYTQVGHKVYSEIQDIEYGIELVTEAMTAFKDNEVKKLSLHNVSKSIAKEYAEFCVKCDQEGLPLIELDNYIEQYCC